jgi:hypothetical protein
MSVFRVQKNKDNPYVMLNKEFLNDDRLSWKAKGLLAYLLSLPDDWQIYEEEIAVHSKDGIKSTRSGLKELIEYNYINRAQSRTVDGKFAGYEYCVFEVPTVMPKTENGETENRKTENRKKHATNKINKLNKKDTKNDNTKTSKQKGNFNNFEQRTYNHDELEQALLGNVKLKKDQRLTEL